MSNQFAVADGDDHGLPDDRSLLCRIIEQAAVGMLLVGPDMRWIYVNPVFCALIGYSRDECIGMTVRQIMHPDDLPQTLVDVEQMYDGRIDSFRRERRYVRKDGSVVWVTISVSRLGAGSKAQPPCHLVQVIDVGGYKQASAALEAKNRENTIYRAMIEALPDLIFAKDLDCRFLAGNAATACFMEADNVDQLIGRTDSSFYPADVAKRLRDDEEAFFTGGQTVVVEQVIQRRDGRHYVLQSTKSLLVDETGRTIGYVGHGRDITREKEREDALEEAYKQLQAQNEELEEARQLAEQASLAKSQFLASMSHEIRTPMTSVLGMADLLATEDLNPTQRRYIETIRRSGNHLLSIINDILDFSRIEAGRLELEHIHFKPLDLLEQVHALMLPQATERALELRIGARAQPSLVVKGDPTRLRQVLVNLTGNALKFTSNGHVTVSIEEQPAPNGWSRLRIEVTDTGIGIPEERQAGLFEAFVQADSSISRHYGGSGLGLAICKRLVGAMGGTIGVRSRPGIGSTFWFELPMPLGDVRMAAEREAIWSTEMLPLRVLVVDDVAVNRELLAEMLRRSGHRVEQAEHGADAVAQVTRGGFDVVLMDVQMPVMNGIEATRLIRELPPPIGTIPVFALTANVMESEQERYLAAGMNACLTKPIVWEQLYAALASISHGQRAESGLEAAAGKAPAKPYPTDAAGEQPLVDRGRIDAMASRMPPAMFHAMVTRAVEGARESCQRLRDVCGDAEALTKEAHRLRGTAGTFGLTRVSSLAGAIEDQLRRGGTDVGAALCSLEAALEESRTVLARYID
ncbi:MAG TPA: PAS domain S-box protein [Geminicoccus sp.]|uniref:PAS domain-containing hybrid sensor histidine kinase/response regulator n=1 Tax=Geminicoccus sp. TaxID=2024832 RepID=UPI002E378BB2|nr:PAS domain S-box protein [Geminicoccus sp.]HEX2525481.1 PAS domain S-box protein [Geminicoccus sp.]